MPISPVVGASNFKDSGVDPADIPTQPWWAAAHMPKHANTAWMFHHSGKGSRTILKGGWLEGGDVPMDGAMGRVYKSIHPFRYPTQENVNRHMWSIGEHIYDPHEGKAGFAGRGLEKMATKVQQAQASGEEASFMATQGTKYAKKIGLLTDEGKAQHVWDASFMGRMSASGRLSRMSSVSDTTTRNTMNYIRSSSPELAETLQGGLAGPAIGGGLIAPELTGAQLSQAVAGTATGAISGRVAGYMTGARGELDPLVREGLENAGNKVFLSGADSAASHLALGGGERGVAGFRNVWATARSKVESRLGSEAGELAAKEAGEVAVKEVGETVVKAGAKAVLKEAAPSLLKFGAVTGAAEFAAIQGLVDPIADVYLAYSLAKTGAEMYGAGISATVKLGQQAFKSMNGQINKAPFGMGFRDNSVAATSRQRGVQAIQASRLNARSVLGNEAAGMHAHFG